MYLLRHSQHTVDHVVLLLRLAGYRQSTERAATHPAAVAAFGGLAAYAYYTNSTTALAEANSTVSLQATHT